MKIRLSKVERFAGLFVFIAFLGFLSSILTIAIKQGWFDSKVYFTTVFDSAEGVHSGTTVQMAGLKVGLVEDVELTSDNKIFIKFYVLTRFEDKMRNDSVISLIRPFIIGERALDISPGSQPVAKLEPGSRVLSIESLDLMTFISGRKMGNYLATMSNMLTNLKNLADAFLDKGRTQTLVDLFDRAEPLIKNLNVMSLEVIKVSRQMNKNDAMSVVLGELAVTTKQLNAMLPEFKDRAPNLAKDMGDLMSNLSGLTHEFKVIIPALVEIAPELPRVSKRSVEALDEAVVLMKAMEKSILVRGNVQEVREEEKNRKPAAK